MAKNKGKGKNTVAPQATETVAPQNTVAPAAQDTRVVRMLPADGWVEVKASAIGRKGARGAFLAHLQANSGKTVAEFGAAMPEAWRPKNGGAYSLATWLAWAANSKILALEAPAQK